MALLTMSNVHVKKRACENELLGGSKGKELPQCRCTSAGTGLYLANKRFSGQKLSIANLSRCLIRCEFPVTLCGFSGFCEHAPLSQDIDRQGSFQPPISAPVAFYPSSWQSSTFEMMSMLTGGYAAGFIFVHHNCSTSWHLLTVWKNAHLYSQHSKGSYAPL